MVSQFSFVLEPTKVVLLLAKVLLLNFQKLVASAKVISKVCELTVTKVIIEKSRGEGSLMEQDTIENVS